jgi:hypothetical protein
MSYDRVSGSQYFEGKSLCLQGGGVQEETTPYASHVFYTDREVTANRPYITKTKNRKHAH